MSTQEELLLLKKELQLLKAEEVDRDLNPHKYFDYYDWQHDFIFQEKHIAEHGRFPHRLYLTASNQIGKTFSLMILAHRLCTDKEFRQWHWKNNQPRVIWYVLPSLDHINDFFEEKWVPEVLSRDEAASKGPYRWKTIKKGSDIKGIHFLETNCKLVFVTLGSKGSALQGRSVGAMIFDEEPDVRKLGELEMRTASFNDDKTGESNAILAFAFTPTTAQEYFKKAFSFQDKKFLERLPEDLLDKFFLDKKTDTYRTCPIEDEKSETFPVSKSVWKRRVSMFEAIKFRSGKRGKFTKKRIYEIISNQPTLRDVLVRVFGAFEKEDNGGLLYKYFNKDIHLQVASKKDIDYYKTTGILTSGIDYGSGSNHPGGFVVTWISEDRKKVRVIKMWRGEKGKITTAGDIIEEYLRQTKEFDIKFPFYDHSCADLKSIYNRITGKALMPAAKDKEGYGLVDTLLKHNMLVILHHDDEPYGHWAASEFTTINHSQQKKDRLDEITDCIRYSLYGINYMFDLDELSPVDVKEVLKKEIYKLKTPEDYGVRSWNNVKEDDVQDKDNFSESENSDWEGYFND